MTRRPLDLIYTECIEAGRIFRRFEVSLDGILELKAFAGLVFGGILLGCEHDSVVAERGVYLVDGRGDGVLAQTEGGIEFENVGLDGRGRGDSIHHHTCPFEMDARSVELMEKVHGCLYDFGGVGGGS